MVEVIKPRESTAAVATETTVAAEKKQSGSKTCECEAFKKRMRAKSEEICRHNEHTSKIQKATSALLFVAVLLAVIYWAKKLNA